ncbi:MAG: hypothetical protein II865_02025 [Bacteroidales bacterium]|nr:hypothetical protein [Bacteroidales bacterium]
MNPVRGFLSVARCGSHDDPHNPVRGCMLDVISEIGHNDIGVGTHVYVLVGVPELVGFILGFTNWALDVPPKFFWTKSRVQLLDNRVGNALGYAVIFFLLPFFVAGVACVVGRL